MKHDQKVFLVFCAGARHRGSHFGYFIDAWKLLYGAQWGIGSAIYAS